MYGASKRDKQIANACNRRYFVGSADVAVFANEDAAFVLAFSLIMLNTNQHSSQLVRHAPYLPCMPLLYLWGI